MIAQNVFSGPFAQVDYFGCGDNRKLLFTFVEFGHRELGGFGFGSQFALKNGFNVVAIKIKADDWYQNLPAELFNIIELFLSGLTERHQWRAAYGSSMGGYAAIRFSKCIAANAVLALSPQFDIMQNWDRRWVAQAESIGAMTLFEPNMVQPDCNYTIVYDSADADRLHFQKYAEIIPSERLAGLAMPHGGHPVGPFLANSGSLKDVVINGLLGKKPPTILQNLRRARRSYPDYFWYLATDCAREKKLKWADVLILKALELDPLSGHYYYQAVQIAQQRGDNLAALKRAAMAVAVSPKDAHRVVALGLSLRQEGLLEQALHYMELAGELLPASEMVKTQREDLRSLLSL